MPHRNGLDDMTFKTTNLNPLIGTLIATDIDTLLSGRAAGKIRALLEERGVIAIRGIVMDDQQQLAVTRTFGEIVDQGSGEIYKVSFDKRENPHAAANYGTFSWHIDRTDTDVPPFATILSAKQLSPTGGQTQFANTYAAYDGLSDKDKLELDNLQVVHSMEAAFRGVPDATEEQDAIWRAVPKKTHPLIWHHRSGKKSLTLSTSAEGVVGMDKAESDALLARLMEWATRPEYVYTHEWTVNDLIMWNNTGTMHRVRPYDPESGRRLHRTTIQGVEGFSGNGQDGISVAAE